MRNTDLKTENIAVTTEHTVPDNYFVKLKTDVVFKKLFGSEENKHILQAFIASLLGIDKSRISDLTIENTELPPEFADEKFGRVDIKCLIDNSFRINLELQICPYLDYKERSLYYWARMFSIGFRKGREYGELRETICINILGFNLFECDEYYSLFKLRETTRNETLTDKLAIHFYELKKLPPKSPENEDNPVLQWLWLINAETEEELNMITNTNVPEIKEAVTIYKHFSKDEQMRINAFEREMAVLDHAAELAASRRIGREEGRTENIIESIRSIMDNLNLNAEQAMKALNIPPEDYERYKELL